MKTPARLPLLAAAAFAVALPATAATTASAKPKYKECEFTKKKAKRHHAPRCKKDLGRSRWIVVSGEYKEVLTIHDAFDSAVFDGRGTTEFQALGLNGNSAFPSRRHPVSSMVSTRPEGVDFASSSKGGWTTKSRFYDCGITAPAYAKPNGFGGIFSLAGKKRVKVQWFIGAAGFGCDEGPYPTPSPDFPDTVSRYPLRRFRGRRIVRLPIAFDFKDVHDSFSARVTYDGIARLRRYR